MNGTVAPVVTITDFMAVQLKIVAALWRISVTDLKFVGFTQPVMLSNLVVVGRLV